MPLAQDGSTLREIAKVSHLPVTKRPPETPECDSELDSETGSPENRKTWRARCGATEESLEIPPERAPRHTPSSRRGAAS